MSEVLNTVSTYSCDLEALFGRHRQRSANDLVISCLDRAMTRERRLQRSAKDYNENLPPDVGKVMMRWGDPVQLNYALERLEQTFPNTVDDVSALVSQGDDALLDYLDRVMSSTNSSEALDVLQEMSRARKEERRRYVWQAMRGLDS